MARYEWLSNPTILSYVDALEFKVQYTQIIILNSNDQPIKAITGRCTGGSVSINGASSMRRAGSLTLVTDKPTQTMKQQDIMNEVTNIDSLISVNKRCSIEVGIVNTGNKFLNFGIFWFPLGTFTILNANVAYNLNSGITISLSLKDKMTLLNGELGGTIPLGIIHSPMADGAASKEEWTTIESDNGQIYEYPPERPVLFKDLINTLTIDFGELAPEQVIIEDIPSEIKNIVRWQHPFTALNIKSDDVVPKAPSLYIYKYTPSIETEEYQDLSFTFGTTIELTNEGLSAVTSGTFEKVDGPYVEGDMPGYVMTSFTYPAEKEFSSNAGESVVSALDKIKNTLGNYEYYIDSEGYFHFKEIKNYLNEGSVFDELGDAINEKYFLNRGSGRATYDLTSIPLTISLNNNPQYGLIKNDYVVWGKDPDTEQPIQYRLVVQDLPPEDQYCLWQVSYDTINTNKVVSAKQVTSNSNLNLSNKSNDKGIWRIKMYLLALESGEQTQFAKELIEKVPLIWSTQQENAGQPLEKWKNNYTKLPYWLDAIATNDSKLMDIVDTKGFSIEKIGRRTKVITEDEINCLFASEVKDQTFYNAQDYWRSGEAPATEEAWVEALVNNFITGSNKQFTSAPPIGGIFLSPFAYTNLYLGTKENPAYERIRSELHTSLSYNNCINISTLPIYHLDVNQRIRVNNDEADVHGDYIINSISIPLQLGGTMSINATRAVERI